MRPTSRDDPRPHGRSGPGSGPAAARAATPILLRDPERLHRLLDRVLSPPAQEEPPDAFNAVARSAVEVFGPLRSELGLEAIAVYAEDGDRLYLRRQVGGAQGQFAETVDVASARHLLLPSRRARVFPDPTRPDAPPSLGMAPPGPTAVRVVEAASARHLLVAVLGASTPPAAAEFVLGIVGTVVAARALRERWRQSLDEAAEIQRELLPAAIPPVPGFEVAARCVPAEVVGGDFYDFLSLGHGTTGIAVGDAVGHGLPAALVARDAVVGLRVAFDRPRPAAGVLARLNGVMRAGLPGRAFASIAYAEVRPDGRVEYVSAGHPPALRVRPGVREFFRRSGPVLGPFEQVSFRGTRSRLAPGELLVLYTDGIVERRNPRGETYSEDRLAALVEAHAAEPVEDILERAFADAAAFGEGSPWADDATIVILRHVPGTGLPAPDEAQPPPPPGAASASEPG